MTYQGQPAVIRPGRRNEDLPPQNLLIKWRSHAGCGFNVSTMCLLLHLQRRYKNEAAQGQAASIASVRLENELRLQFDYPWGCIRTQTRAIDGRRLTNGLRDLTELIAIHVGVREGKVRMIRSEERRVGEE